MIHIPDKFKPGYIITNNTGDFFFITKVTSVAYFYYHLKNPDNIFSWPKDDLEWTCEIVRRI